MSVKKKIVQKRKHREKTFWFQLKAKNVKHFYLAKNSIFLLIAWSWSRIKNVVFSSSNPFFQCYVAQNIHICVNIYMHMRCLWCCLTTVHRSIGDARERRWIERAYTFALENVAYSSHCMPINDNNDAASFCKHENTYEYEMSASQSSFIYLFILFYFLFISFWRHKNAEHE